MVAACSSASASWPEPPVTRIGRSTISHTPADRMTCQHRPLCITVHASPINMSLQTREKMWMAGLRLIGVEIGRGARPAIPFVMAAVGPPATPCSAYTGRSRGWRTCARHDVVATAVPPTYFNAYGACAWHDDMANASRHSDRRYHRLNQLGHWARRGSTLSFSERIVS